MLEQEVPRRADSLEGYGTANDGPTPLQQKEVEAEFLATGMTARELLRHQDYIEKGSETYNPFQRRAVACQVALRSGPSDGFWGFDGAET